jgi:hypothetical protein
VGVDPEGNPEHFEATALGRILFSLRTTRLPAAQPFLRTRASILRPTEWRLQKWAACQHGQEKDFRISRWRYRAGSSTRTQGYAATAVGHCRRTLVTPVEREFVGFGRCRSDKLEARSVLRLKSGSRADFAMLVDTSECA